ncbi:2-oxoglutarate dehydrogenase complex dihydrolipoyllysine-residue succinyltransferase [Candidatus Oscillochloris fontis]|uniref:2-oxoglutarate dehydrogenase complex dihydrolipoyllysine-residue succinyltransferase n=1 Tax=Candidatus Oscillochloris fontis TaxID=2496868 RepID=UPI00101C8D76|nr:2-oxoglutarate dehydrogenase complex dihydrolipoyllysine-residue succinyltransferase [Candidatus Oscillochloris fontis]
MAYEIKVPALGESIVEATVAKWLKREGDPVAAGEAVVELETDKVNLEVASDHAGVLGSILCGEGATVAIGDVLATVGAGSGVVAQAVPVVPVPVAATSAPAPAPAPVAATPLAQRVAAEHALDLSGVAGSGVDGRVTKVDVLKAVAPAPAPVAPAPAPVAPAPAPVAPAPAPVAPAPAPVAPKPAPAAPVAVAPSGRPEERQRLSRRRLTIARRLVEAQQSAAILTTFNEIDMSAVMELRKRRKDSFKERNGVNLGFMSFFTRAVIGALKAYPIVNAEIQGDEVVLKHYYDIGIAVGVDEGLVVPVVRDADRKGFAALEREIGELAGKARAGTLSLAELQGGTFTITNGGVYGSLMSTPILNTPQVGILGMHKIEERAVVVGGQIVIRPMMYVAFSYDHRLIDGSTSVRFLVRIKELIEDPEALLLEG